MSNYIIAISKLMTAAYMVNQLTEKAAFVRYSGHVNGISVYVSEGKNDEQYNKWLKDIYIHMWDENTDRVQRDFDEATAYLESLIKEAETCGA